MFIILGWLLWYFDDIEDESVEECCSENNQNQFFEYVNVFGSFTPILNMWKPVYTPVSISVLFFYEKRYCLKKSLI